MNLRPFRNITRKKSKKLKLVSKMGVTIQLQFNYDKYLTSDFTQL